MEKYDCSQMTICRFCITCWITNATHKHTHTHNIYHLMLFHCNHRCKNALWCTICTSPVLL